MNIRPKSPDELRAQGEAFAESHDDEQKRNLYLELGDDLNKPIEELREKPEYQEYINWLRDKGASESAIQARLTAIRAYEPFQEDVTRIKQELLTDHHDNLHRHPDNIGKGTILVMRFETAGKQYIARMTSNPDYMREDYIDRTIEEYYQYMVAGRGLAHFEQVVAFSTKDGAVISEFVPGKSFNELSLGDLQQITNEQIKQAIEAIIAAAKRNIIIDIDATNFIYEPGIGFTFIDYLLAHKPTDANLQVMGFYDELLQICKHYRSIEPQGWQTYLQLIDRLIEAIGGSNLEHKKIDIYLLDRNKKQSEDVLRRFDRTDTD